MKKLIFIFFLIGTVQFSFAQEEEWQPRTHITGYVNTIAEFTDLQSWKDAGQDAGIGLSQAGFLVSYKPLEKLEIKGTMVYTHQIEDIQSLLVEAYGTYTINEKIKLSAGKYLTPLSPINQYFYAPLNPSATLPMVVSHHFMLPQSISGFQVSGEFGEGIKICYNLTYGHYMSSGHAQEGIIGLQGMEDLAVYLLEVPDLDKSYLLGGTGRIYGTYNDVVNVGLNYFDARKAVYPVQELTATGVSTFYTPSTRYSFGVDMQLKFSGLKINAEYWLAEQETTDLANNIKEEYEAYYAEIIYETGIFSPYFRYDYLYDLKGSLYSPFPDTKFFDMGWKTTSYTIGLAVRPIYEILLKLEYRNITSETVYANVNIPGPLQPIFPLDNPLGITEDSYNHFILSLVYSF